MDKMGARWIRLKSAFLHLHLRIKLCLSFVPVMTRRFTQSQGYYFSVGGAFLHPGDTGPAGLETQSVATRVGGVVHGNFWVD